MKAVLERNLSFIGYPNYSVDTEGNVWSYKCGEFRKLNGNNNGGGYLMVGLFQDGVRKRFTVHRLVAMAFIPNPDNKQCIDHIDGDKTNNSANNLRWCTYKENNNNPITCSHISEARKGKHHTNETKRKMSKAKKGANNPLARAVLQYTRDGQFVAEYSTIKQAAQAVNINGTNITNCCKGKYKSAGNFIWKYKKEN